MSAFEQHLLREIEEKWRRTRCPVRTLALSVSTNTPERTTRYWLVRAEEAGVIKRKGKRGGWLPARVAA